MNKEDAVKQTIDLISRRAAINVLCSQCTVDKPETCSTRCNDVYELLNLPSVHMKRDEAYDLLCKEYLSKCRESGCDGCVAEYYCIKHNLRKDRYPQEDCVDKLKKYFSARVT